MILAAKHLCASKIKKLVKGQKLSNEIINAIIQAIILTTFDTCRRNTSSKEYNQVKVVITGKDEEI